MIEECELCYFNYETNYFYFPSYLLRSANKQNAKFLCNLLKLLINPSKSKFYFVFYLKVLFSKKNFPLIKSKF